jgi:hypothetical protein
MLVICEYRHGQPSSVQYASEDQGCQSSKIRFGVNVAPPVVVI